jgi:hypothetical protein
LADVQMPVLAAARAAAAAVLPVALCSALASAGRAVAAVTAAAHPAASTMIIGPRPLRIITAPSALILHVGFFAAWQLCWRRSRPA